MEHGLEPGYENMFNTTLRKMQVIYKPYIKDSGNIYAVIFSGSVVVTAYDFESGRLGSNPEWGSIY